MKRTTKYNANHSQYYAEHTRCAKCHESQSAVYQMLFTTLYDALPFGEPPHIPCSMHNPFAVLLFTGPPGIRESLLRPQGHSLHSKESLCPAQLVNLDITRTIFLSHDSLPAYFPTDTTFETQLSHATRP